MTSPTLTQRPEVGADIPAHFPDGRRRFIQWVRRFGHSRLAVALGMPHGSGRATVHSWTNLSAERLIAPAPKYMTHIVELSREFHFGGDPLRLEDLLEGTGGLRGAHSEPQQAWRYLAPGVRVNILDLDMSVITIDVVAKLLANLPRFAGAAGLYSVAQHCCLGTEWLLEHDPMPQPIGSLSRRRRAYDFLMHDSHEAILQDVISPISTSLVGDRYRQRKREVDLQFARHFGYRSEVNNEPGSDMARRIDQAMLATEELAFFGETSSTAKPLPIEIEVWDPQTSYLRFLDLYHYLKPAQEVAA